MCRINLDSKQSHTLVHILCKYSGIFFSSEVPLYPPTIIHGYLCVCIGMNVRNSTWLDFETQRNKKQGTDTAIPSECIQLNHFSKLIVPFDMKKYRRRCTAAHDHFFAILFIRMPAFDKTLILIINFANLLRHVCQQQLHAMLMPMHR